MRADCYKAAEEHNNNNKKESAQLVMHVTRKDHRESSPTRRWRNIILETMKNIKKLTHTLVALDDGRRRADARKIFQSAIRKQCGGD